jgi:hypothetical protein
MSNYLTIAEAQTYFDGRLNTEVWDDATEDDQTKSLTMATKTLDRLNYLGTKTDANQDNQFPRFQDATIPQDIKDACAEIALAFLDGVDPELEYESLLMMQQTFDVVKTTYDRTMVQEHIIAGVPSIVAWRLIKPYLRDNRSIDLSRVS